MILSHEGNKLSIKAKEDVIYKYIGDYLQSVMDKEKGLKIEK